MRLILLTIFIFLSSCSYAYSQTVELKPGETVTTQSFVDDSTKAFTELVAIRAELATAKQAVIDMQQKVVVPLQIELAKTVGEKTGVDTAIIKCEAREANYIKMIRPKQNGLINIKLFGN